MENKWCWALVLAVMCLGEASATTYYYNASMGDDGNGGLTWADAFATPQATALADGDVLRFAAGHYYVTSEITAAVTLVGAGHETILDANRTNRVLSVSTGVTTIANMTLQNGEPAQDMDGGCVLVSGATGVARLHVSGVLFTGCVVHRAYGGAIAVTVPGACVHVEDTQFRRNYANPVGAIDGHSIAYDRSECSTWQDVRFVDNVSYYRGALWAYMGTDTVIANLHIENQYQYCCAGRAILALIGMTTDPLDIRGLRVTNCAYNGGEGITFVNANVSLYDLDMDRQVITSAGARASGLSLYNTDLRVYDSSLRDNTCDGSTVYVDATSRLSLVNTSISGSAPYNPETGIGSAIHVVAGGYAALDADSLVCGNGYSEVVGNVTVRGSLAPSGVACSLSGSCPPGFFQLPGSTPFAAGSVACAGPCDGACSRDHGCEDDTRDTCEVCNEEAGFVRLLDNGTCIHQSSCNLVSHVLNISVSGQWACAPWACEAGAVQRLSVVNTTDLASPCVCNASTYGLSCQHTCSCDPGMGVCDSGPTGGGACAACLSDRVYGANCDLACSCNATLGVCDSGPTGGGACVSCVSADAEPPLCEVPEPVASTAETKDTLFAETGVGSSGAAFGALGLVYLAVVGVWGVWRRKQVRNRWAAEPKAWLGESVWQAVVRSHPLVGLVLIHPRDALGRGVRGVRVGIAMLLHAGVALAVARANRGAYTGGVEWEHARFQDALLVAAVGCLVMHFAVATWLPVRRALLLAGAVLGGVFVAVAVVCVLLLAVDDTTLSAAPVAGIWGVSLIISCLLHPLGTVIGFFVLGERALCVLGGGNGGARPYAVTPQPSSPRAQESGEEGR